MTTAERIFSLIDNMGMEQKAFAAAINAPESSVSNWRVGRTQSYKKYLPKIAEALGTTVDYLLTGKISPSAIPGSGRKSIPIPVLGTVAAGIPLEAIEEIIDYEEIDSTLAADGEYFGLRIRGDSMEPRMREGDVVIVRKQSDADTGDIVVVLVNGQDATVKKLKKGPDGITLIPLNPAFDPIFYSNKEIESLPVSIIGRVVELRAKF